MFTLWEPSSSRKNDLFEPLALREIQSLADQDEEMHQVYNMGHRLRPIVGN